MQKSILDMTVQDYMTAASQINSVQKTDPLQKIIPPLINAGTHHVAVFDGKIFLGFFGYKQLARLFRRPVLQTQVGEHIIKPPPFLSSASLIDAAESMYRLNYKILPVMEGGKLAGVLSERDILRAAMDAGELNAKKVEEFMTPEPITIRDTDTLGRAISILRDRNVSRLPVVDAGGKTVGAFESLDVMREMYTNQSAYGVAMGKSMNPQKGSMTVGAYGPDEMPAYRIAVKSLMKTLPITAKIGDGIASAFREVLARNMTSVIVVDAKNRPTGIVVPKDIIQYIAQFKEKEAVYIQISGLESIEQISDFQKEEVHRMIDEAVRKLAKIMNMQFFTMHYKVHHAADAEKSKFSIRCKLGRYMVTDYGWDIIDVTSKVLGAFERLLISKEQKIRTKMRERSAHRKHANETTIE